MKEWTVENISSFSGPLDLLYEMVKEKKINVLDLNISEITDQYVQYLKSQQDNFDIEIASEYLAVAAMLLELKSRSILPSDDDDEEDDADYDTFIKQLSNYEQIRSVADYFSKKQQEYLKTMSPEKSKQQFKKIEKEAFEQEEENTSPEDYLKDLSLNKFAEIYTKVLEKQQRLLYEQQEMQMDDMGDDDYNYIETTVLSPKEITQMILDKMNQNRVKEYSIFELLDVNTMNVQNLISIFLSILDLVKYQIISIRDDDSDDLKISFTKYALDNPDAMNGLDVDQDYE